MNNIVYINKFISDNDIEKIKDKIKILNKDVYEKVDYLEIDKYKNINDVIQILCEPLIKDCLINDEYIKCLESNLSNNFENMLVNNNTLILHSSPSLGVLKKGYAIIVGILKNPLNYNNKTIEYFIVVVPYRKLTHLKPISKIVDIILENKNNKVKDNLKEFINNEYKR